MYCPSHNKQIRTRFDNTYAGFDAEPKFSLGSTPEPGVILFPV